MDFSVRNRCYRSGCEELPENDTKPPGAIFNGNGDFEAITITPQSLASADEVTIADAAGMVFITSDSEDTTRPVIRNEFTVPGGKTTPESLDIPTDGDSA